LVTAQLPGLTGDTYGAINEATQTLALVMLVLVRTQSS
jgi:cobalamin synthase